MKVEVKTKFRDIHTKEIHFVGDIMEIDAARYEEISEVSKRLVEVIEDESENADEEKDIEESKIPTRETLEKMKLEELRKKAEEMGLDSKGKKEEIINRMIEQETENEKYEN